MRIWSPLHRGSSLMFWKYAGNMRDPVCSNCRPNTTFNSGSKKSNNQIIANEKEKCFNHWTTSTKIDGKLQHYWALNRKYQVASTRDWERHYSLAIETGGDTQTWRLRENRQFRQTVSVLPRTRCRDRATLPAALQLVWRQKNWVLLHSKTQIPESEWNKILNWLI